MAAKGKADPKVITAEFKFDKETKNTCRFVEDAPDGEEVIGSLYLQKHAIGDFRGTVSVAITLTE